MHIVKDFEAVSDAIDEGEYNLYLTKRQDV